MSKRNRSANPSRRDVLKYVQVGAVSGLMAGGGTLSAVEMSGAGTSTAGPAPAGSHGTMVAGRAMSADVVVVGGGMAGVCAAIAAARNGASVALVQDRPVLGGNSSSEVRLHVLGATGSSRKKQTDARESGIMEELKLEEVVTNPQRSHSLWDLILLDRVKREKNITLLLNTYCTGVIMAGDQKIAAVLASRPASEETFTIEGKLFIDCSGDGRLGAEAGARFRVGREGKGEFGESMAPDQPDRQTLGSSILFVTRPYDHPMPFRPPGWIHRFPKCEDLPHRPHGDWSWGFWWVEWGGNLDTIKDGEKIRDELLAAALGVWDHIKNSGQHPTSENWALDWIGVVPGKRESRRFIGDYMLTQGDVQNGEVFNDGVAFGGWPIDLHPADGIYSKERPCDQVGVPLYNIPFRCLYSVNIDNLLFAGRNVSVSHVAFGSTRVMATCGVMGQAVGTAAAMCAQRGTLPRALGRDSIRELQQQLLKDDAYIIGVTNGDPDDLARQARVRASSATADGPAANVINGVHRVVAPQMNCWISDPADKLPQWIELRFPKAKKLREIHLVFDSGLHRHLSISLDERHSARMIRQAQPETVRDYELQVLDGESARTVAKVTGNYQRKCIHRIESTTAAGIRLVIQATNGNPSARVFEVRAYS